jgi:hypothetical protein
MTTALPPSVFKIASVFEKDIGLLAESESLLEDNTSATLPQMETMEPYKHSAALVRVLESFLRSYVVLPEHTALPLALWVMMTYTFNSFEAVPYLAITSPTPGCGKTRLLECLELLVSNPRRASNVSEAALFRTIDKFSPTLLLDEGETLSGKSERAEYLVQIINAGNRMGAVVGRCVGEGANQDIKEFSVFCPKVLAGIGSFPRTITDRAIMIAMQRRKESETVSRFLYGKVKPKGKLLSEMAVAFASSRREEIAAAFQGVDLTFISDRDAEAWSPLFAILSVAAPERLNELRACAEYLTRAKSANAEDDSLALRLLADMRSVWPESEQNMPSKVMLERLRGIEDGPWASDERFDARKLAKMLRPFGIKSVTVRVDGGTLKGYAREDVQSVFARYLGSQPSQASQPA